MFVGTDFNQMMHIDIKFVLNLSDSPALCGFIRDGVKTESKYQKINIKTR